MDPSDCTIVVLASPPSPTPYVIDKTDVTTGSPTYITHLQSVFGHVCVRSNPAEALEQVKQRIHASPTLLLVDLDTLEGDTGLNRDDESLYTLPSTAPPSSIANRPDPRLIWIQKIAHHEEIPVVVCSINDTPAFMLSCIQAGATDYLLKPLRLDVIKPLFLKIHRYRHDSKTHNSSLPSSPISCPDHYISNSIPRSAAMTATPSMTNTTSSSTITGSITTLCDNVTHRIKDIFHKDIQFTQAVMDIYVPTRLPNHHMRLTTENTARLKAKVSSWDFSPFDFDHEELIHIVYIIFNEILSTKELSHITITEGQLYDFIIDLSNTYRDENPYHNFAHAVDVLQCIYYFISQLGVLDHPSMETDPILPHHLLRPKDVFALFIAAIGHDAAHPGVNNMFLINSATPLAMLYNDRSVLESLHSMTLFHIMKRHHLDQIVGGAGSTDYQEFRKTVVTSVLATDMSLHNDYVCKIKDQAVRLREADLKTMDATARENERLLLCSALIKCADISNVTRPFRRGAKWAELLVQEFLSQGDLEKELGMPVLPMNDRDKVVLEESQIGFIRFVALDLFQSIRDVIPPISFAVDYMQDNLKRWENLKNTKTRDTLSVKEDVNIELRIGRKRSRSTSVECEIVHKRLSLDTHVRTIPSVSVRSGALPDTSATNSANASPSWSDASPIFACCSIQ